MEEIEDREGTIVSTEVSVKHELNRSRCKNILLNYRLTPMFYHPLYYHSYHHLHDSVLPLHSVSLRSAVQHYPLIQHYQCLLQKEKHQEQQHLLPAQLPSEHHPVPQLQVNPD